jgi:type IV pilus assembly protein PilV
MSDHDRNPRERRRPPRVARGYTMVEVMMALGVLAVGASGIVAMQKAAVVGNASAKSIATANELAIRWAERLRVDAMVWNTFTPLSDLGETRWLKGASFPPDWSAADKVAWILPTIIPGKASPYADPLGADIVDVKDASAVAYCTHIALRTMPTGPNVVPDPLKPETLPKMISAIVRVTWRRDWSAIDCQDPDLLKANTDFSRFGAVYLTTGLMMQERP